MKYLLTFIFSLLMANDAVALCEIEKLKAEQKQKEADEYRTNPRGQGAGGVTGSSDSDFAWRWSPTPEERLLARAADERMVRQPTEPGAAVPEAGADAETGAHWPGFRGSERDGVIDGVQVVTDWNTSPPDLLWRRLTVIVEDHIFTY